MFYVETNLMMSRENITGFGICDGSLHLNSLMLIILMQGN